MRLDYDAEEATWGRVRFYIEERNARRSGSRRDPRTEALDDLVSRQLHDQLALMLDSIELDDDPFFD